MPAFDPSVCVCLDGGSEAEIWVIKEGFFGHLAVRPASPLALLKAEPRQESSVSISDQTERLSSAATSDTSG
ncbi:hypothetical protein NL676_005323 [Syzygium grande]|nr:hypothetical protein NL676_005323 [Syzygium grande]